MLMTITTTHTPATDLGYLLHKNPSRCQTKELAFGAVHIFYPKACDEECTMAMLLDIDPIEMVRGGRRRTKGVALEHYINDRPYVTSSFVSVAIAQTLGTALKGQCKERPELPDQVMPLRVKISVLPCRGGEKLLRRLFEPLGYEVKAEGCALSETFDQWGPSPYYTVELSKTTTVSTLLSHLYVLIPVLDNQKHYYIGQDEVEKLIAKGQSWLADHPEKELIARRYLKHRTSLASQALSRLTDEEGSDPDDHIVPDDCERQVEEKTNLNEDRMATIASNGLEMNFRAGPGVSPSPMATPFDSSRSAKKLRILVVRRRWVCSRELQKQAIDSMELKIPKLSLVVLIGPSGSGKSTFAGKHFLGTEILSSDYCRGLVCDDENSQEATTDAFEVLHFIAGKRLAAGKLTVVDATNVQPEARKPLVALARQYHCLPVAIVLNLPEKLCQERNEQRPGRDFGRHVIRTVNIDTGCVYGGRLTALRYPEREFVSVQARATYCQPIRPVHNQGQTSEPTAQQIHDDVLDAEDILGKRFISTRLRQNITIREENATAALDVMSRYAVNPKWLIYLPPTMSPAETSEKDGYLECPTEAFAFYRSKGVPKVVCEQKHMGSRAVVIVCKDEDVSQRRFGVQEKALGVVYTRTGRPFFSDPSLEQTFLEQVKGALDAAGFWGELDTDWVALDCELMPWSAKAQELLRTQYAAVGAAATASLDTAVTCLEQTAQREDIVTALAVSAGQSSNDVDVHQLLAKYATRQDLISKYIRAYEEYCWPVESLDDLKLAPFHILATEGKTYMDADHQWHMETLARICDQEAQLLLATPFRLVDVTDEASVDQATQWWEELTGSGGEGMVVKPFVYITKGKKGVVQPALKCRGREYLRIIYGPEYTLEKHLTRLRNRHLGAKRSLAMRELALGVEALERFIRREPLRRVHECVFGVLALESEPVDPGL